MTFNYKWIKQGVNASKKDGNTQENLERLLFSGTFLRRWPSGSIYSSRSGTLQSNMTRFIQLSRGPESAFCYRFEILESFRGLHLLFQIAVGDISTFAFVVEDAEMIAGLVARCAVLEQLYLHGTSATTMKLKDALSKLYKAIISYFSEAKRYFQQNSLSVYEEDSWRVLTDGCLSL
jgi:hypothetical protein